MKRQHDLTQGFVDTIPLGISVAMYGIVYGVMGGKTGLSPFEVMALSIFVFAGASQMIAIQMIASGATPVSIILTVFIVNLRHFLMAASLAPYLTGVTRRLKMIASYFMTDESFAVSYSYFSQNRGSVFYLLGSGLAIYVFWGAASIVGYLCGNLIPRELGYIFDFAFVAAFLGMLVPMIKGFPVIIAVVTSALLSIVGSLWLPGKWYILVATLGASLAGFLADMAIRGRNVMKTEANL